MEVASRSLFERTARRLRIVAAIVAIVGLLYLFGSIVQQVLAGGLLAYVLNPLVSRLEARTSRNWATLIVFIGLTAATGLVLYLLMTVGRAQLEQIINSAGRSQGADELRQFFDSLGLIGSQGFDLGEKIRSTINQGLGALFSRTQNVLSVAIGIFIVPFVAVFLLRDGPQIKRQLIRLVPNRYFEFALDALHKVDQQLGNYFRGLVLDMIAVMILSTTALWLIGIDAFILLGIFCGLVNVIPYVGIATGGVMSIVVTLMTTNSNSMISLVAIAFVGIAVLDEGVIQPYVMSQTVELHPLEIIIAVAVAAKLFGIPGMVLAIPLASAGKVVVTEGFTLIQRYRFD